MYLISIDPDTHQIAAAIFKDGDFQTVKIISRADARGRIREGYDHALEAFALLCADVGAAVFLAGRGEGSVTGFQSLARVHGELLAAFSRHSVPVELIPAVSWQSKVLPRARGRDAIKAASIANATAITGRDDLTEHESDAVNLGLHALTLQTALF